MPRQVRQLKSRCFLGADFLHLKEVEPREKRKQTDKLVRTSLQILIQHSYVVAHLIRPESTRKNKTPDEYQIYNVDVAAITRSIRCNPQPNFTLDLLVLHPLPILRNTGVT
jgi:hypothetical protein